MADEDEEVVDIPLFQDVVERLVVATLVVDLVDLYDLARDDDVLKDLVRAVVDHVVVLVDVEELVLDLLVDDAVALVDELSVVALSDADLDVNYLVDILVDPLSHDVLLEVVVVVVVSLYVVAINHYVVVVDLYVVIAVDVLVVVVDTLDVVDELSLFVVDH